MKKDRELKKLSFIIYVGIILEKLTYNKVLTFVKSDDKIKKNLTKTRWKNKLKNFFEKIKKNWKKLLTKMLDGLEKTLEEGR